MEKMFSDSAEPITIRQNRLQHLINGKAAQLLGNPNHSTKEVLLDALVAVYDELSKDSAKNDKFVNSFLERFRPFVAQVSSLRVNISDFEIKQVIGRGHFGEVKLVREKLTGDVYAMKTLKKADTLALQNVTFYEEERDIMAQSASQWITCLRYAFQDPHNLYLVMDFHPGGDLFGLLDRLDGSLSEEAARFYIAELALAVQSLHKMGYVHRDIKPENILFDRLGHLKLADFGSAARLGSDGKVSSCMPVGTAEYIAPEVLRAMEAELDSNKRPSYGIQCDYWSMGIVGYEMVYGTTPFQSERKTVLVNQILNHKEHLQFPDDKPASDEFRTLISALLEVSSKRYGHKEVIRHPFFHTIDWDNIRDMVPEFVPQVSSLDDTSNFEEFDQQSSSISVDDFLGKGSGFTGRNLPFVGFTFTRTDGKLGNGKVEEIERDKENQHHKRRSLLEVNVIVNEKNKFGDITQKLTTEIKRRRQADERVKTLESALDESKKLARDRGAELQKACTMLEKERADRRSNEAAALVKVREMKKQMTDHWTATLTALEGELEAYKSKCSMIEDNRIEVEKNLEVVVGELSLAKKELKSLRATHSEFKEKTNRRSMMPVAPVKAAVDDSVMEFKSNELRTELEATKEELLKVKNANSELEVEVARLQEELDFATAENDSRIRELEDDLADKEANQQALQLLGDENRELKSRISKLESENDTVTKNFTVTSSKYLELQVKVNLLEKTLSESSLNSSFATNQSSGDLDTLQSRILHLNDELGRAKEECARSQTVIQRLKEEVANKEREIQQKVCMQDSDKFSVSSGDSAIASATPPPQVHGLVDQLENRIKRLEDQLQSARDLNTAERKRMRETQDELTAKTRDAGDMKIDLRISERKLKQAQEMLEQLENEKNSWNEKQASRLKETIDLKAKVAGVQSTVESLENSLKSKEDDLKSAQEKHTAEVERLQRRIEAEQKKVEAMKELKAELVKAKDELVIANRQKASAMTESSTVAEKLKAKDEQERSLRETIGDLRKQVTVKEKGIADLKNVLTVLEEENISHFEDVDELKARLVAMEEKYSLLAERAEKTKEELKANRIALNEEKSMKIFNEKKMRDIESTLKALKQETDSEISNLTSKLVEQMAYTEELSAMKSELSEQLVEREDECASLSKYHDGAEEQLRKLKEDLALSYTKINSLQDTNSALVASLEEAIDKIEKYKMRSEELQNILTGERQHFKEREIKSGGTIAQQAKLIDYLQARVEAPPKKKKNFIEKIFGGGGKDAGGNFVLPAGYKEIEAALRKERQENRTLKEQSDRLRSELAAVNLRGPEGGILKRNTDDRKSQRSSKPVKEVPLGKTPEVLPTPSVDGQPPAKPQRMAHDIPHRFVQKINLHGTQCPLCLDNIPIGPYVAVCSECKCTAHVKCSHKLPATCGLPYAFAEQFSTSSDVHSSSDVSLSPAVLKDLKGWVKIPKTGKGRWEKRFLSISGQKLMWFEHEPVAGMEPVESVDLNSQTQRVFIIPAVQQSEVPHCASTDLPFVFKVETQPHTTCFPGRSLYVLTSDFDEKRKWVAALEHTCNGHDRSPQRKKVALANAAKHCRTMATWKSVKMEVSCAVELKDVVLLGTNDGLYAASLSDPSRKPVFIDVGGPVHQVLIVPQISAAVMIAGENRNVVLTKLGVLQTLASSTTPGTAVELTPVSDHIECHLVAAAMLEDLGQNGEAFMCAADPTRVMVSHWDKSLRNFTVIKCIKTSLPCSTLYFTSQSALVGCEKLLEVDLKKFEVEDFLDASDSSLGMFVFSARQLSLYPLAILDVSSRKRKQSEYLICYKQYGIFVDAWGKRTRPEDIKWSRVPLAFSFQKPFLFLVHTSSVEVVRLQRDSYTRVRPAGDGPNSDVLSLDSAAVILPDNVHLQVTNPRLLGTSSSRGSIFLLSRVGDEQTAMELSGEAVLRRNTSDVSQDSLQSTSTEDPDSFRPPLRNIPDDLSSVTSTANSDSTQIMDLLDDAMNFIDSEPGDTTASSLSADGRRSDSRSKRPSSEMLRSNEGKKVKFSERPRDRR